MSELQRQVHLFIHSFTHSLTCSVSDENKPIWMHAEEREEQSKVCNAQQSQIKCIIEHLKAE